MTMSNRDTPGPADLYASHVFARLLQGGEVTASECAAIMDASIRDAAVAMFAAPTDERARTLWSHLGDESDWWLDLSLSADVTTTAPEDGAWRQPTVPADSSLPAFPLDVFPPSLASYAWQVAQVMACAPDYPAAAVLVVAGGALGRSALIQLKASWREPASLFLAMVGDPGSTKSPAIDAVCSPAWKVQAELLAAHKLILDEFKAAKKARLASAKSGQPTDGVEADPPPPSRFVVSDYTIESLVQILRHNPRGVLVVRDEITALFAGMNQYKAGGKGSDRQFYLSAWSGAAVVVDRKTQADQVPAFVASPFLSILGGMTPGMLSELREGRSREDGMIDRFLFAFPERTIVRWNDWVVDYELALEWEQAIRRLHSRVLPILEDGRAAPVITGLSPIAVDVWVEWHDSHCEEADGLDFPPCLRGAWAKMRAYTARFALILEYLAWAYDPTSQQDDVRVVSPDSMVKAIRLAEYFKSHTRVVRTLLDSHTADRLGENARAILEWARKRGLTAFSQRECQQSMRRRWAHGGLGEALAELVSSGHLDVEPSAPTGGRPRSPVYQINPLSSVPLETEDVP